MKVNHVIRTLVLSDFFVNAGFSIFAPVFAVFVTKQISGGSLEVIGFAAAIFQIFKVCFQIPVARILDRNHGEMDDFYSMIFGSIIISLVPFMYLFASESVHIYIIQAIYGIGAAFSIPPWYAIFSRHMDKMKENVESFKKAHKNYFITKGKVYSKEKVNFSLKGFFKHWKNKNADKI